MVIDNYINNIGRLRSPSIIIKGEGESPHALDIIPVETYLNVLSLAESLQTRGARHSWLPVKCKNEYIYRARAAVHEKKIDENQK